MDQYGLYEIKHSQLQVFTSSLSTYTAQPGWAPLTLSVHMLVVLFAHSTATEGCKKT